MIRREEGGEKKRGGGWGGPQSFPCGAEVQTDFKEFSCVAAGRVGLVVGGFFPQGSAKYQLTEIPLKSQMGSLLKTMPRVLLMFESGL